MRAPTIRESVSESSSFCRRRTEQKLELSLTPSVGLFPGMTYAETHNYRKVRRAHDSVPLCIEPPPHAFLDPFFGRCGKTSRRDVLPVLHDRAASFANEREVLGETCAPIADCKMQPNTKAFAQRKPAIHRLRQKMGHVLARRRDRLDPGNYSCRQPAVRFH